MRGEDVDLIACHNRSAPVTPYARLLGDAMRGDQMLFGREDTALEAWRVIDPVLGQVTPLYEYDKGTWGPAEADGLLADGQGWHNPAQEWACGD